MAFSKITVSEKKDRSQLKMIICMLIKKNP